MRRLLPLLLLFAAGAALAQPPDSNAAITVSDAWARPTASAQQTGAVYLTITGTTPDRLIAADTPVAAMAMLHETRNDHGVMRMRMVESLPVTPGKPVVLAPGGYHLMLTGLGHKLAAGETFPLTLHFDHAGAVKTAVTVREAISGPAHMQGM